MRENRTYGSEGGEAKAFPTPIAAAQQTRGEHRRGPARAYECGGFWPLANLRALDAPNRVDGRDKHGHDVKPAHGTLFDAPSRSTPIFLRWK
jgi:hypothetical protein